MLAWAGCPAADAQITRGIPSDEHFAAFTPYLNGDFRSAGRAFEHTSRIKSTGGVWIDSIPYHTMIGECMYQMGDLAGALEQYSAALQVFLSYPNWLLLLEYPNAIAFHARGSQSADLGCSDADHPRSDGSGSSRHPPRQHR